MKKLIMIAMLAFFGNMLVAQTPDNVKANFKTKYPNATGVYWKNEKNNQYKVNYMENNSKYAVVYDKDGNVVREESVVKNDAAPAGISEYYKTKTTTTTSGTTPVADYTVWEVKDKDGNVSYYTEYQGKTAWFDKDGKITTRKDMATGDDIKPQDEKMPVEK